MPIDCVRSKSRSREWEACLSDTRRAPLYEKWRLSSLFPSHWPTERVYGAISGGRGSPGVSGTPGFPTRVSPATDLEVGLTRPAKRIGDRSRLRARGQDEGRAIGPRTAP